MKKATISILSGLLMLLIPNTGCDTDTVSQALLFMGNIAPDNSCQVKAQGGAQQVFIGEGTLDLSVGTRYQAHVMAKNLFPTTEEMTGEPVQTGTMESTTVVFTHLDVTYRMDPSLLAQQSVLDALADVGIPATTEITIQIPVSATLEAATSLPIVVDLVPHNMGLVFRAMPQIAEGQTVQVALDVIGNGFRADLLTVKTAVWTFSVLLCNNCTMDHVFSEAIAKQPFTFPGLDKPLEGADFGEFCVPGQDRRITNAYCGAQWGPDAATSDPCKLDRCLGKATETLQCDTDKKTVLAPPAAVP